jgi:7-carboxy-7-deazaguanine synthase
MDLVITELFKSIQGESSWAGRPCSFVRLTGCPLRCRWCDSVYTFKGGTTMSIADIMETIAGYGVPLVEVTGGEPLAQENCITLLQNLCEAGYTVLLETSGAMSIAEVPASTHIIMDIKCPDSKMADRNLWSNISHLKPKDEVKFVIASREDFDWACAIIKEHALTSRCAVLLSPAWGLVAPEVLAAWILEANVHCRLNLQLHKYLWGPRARGV